MPPIYVTRPYLPPLEEFIPYLRTIWDNGILTNGGPYHQELERALAEHLGVAHISLFANGTLALLTALQALDVNGEVITTPYSFVATSHALLWNNIRPVFVDIDPDTCNLDPDKIEAAITPRTRAILPVHCYGIPCDVRRIGEIAAAHGLRVIHDAAHAFGVADGEGSILRHGDLSVLSFHATKVFNTFEGGAIVSADPEMKRHIDHLKNFGFTNETTVVAPGINGKMNELQAAMGLLQLRHIDAALGLRCLRPPEQVTWNHAYFPVLVMPGYPLDRDALYARLRRDDIRTRRYFYPLISAHPMYRDLPSAHPDNLPVARDMAERILCLPIYPDLSDGDQDRIIEILCTPGPA